MVLSGMQVWTDSPSDRGSPVTCTHLPDDTVSYHTRPHHETLQLWEPQLSLFCWDNILASVPRSWNISCPRFRNCSYVAEIQLTEWTILKLWPVLVWKECFHSHVQSDHSESICTTFCLCTGTINGYALRKRYVVCYRVMHLERRVAEKLEHAIDWEVCGDFSLGTLGSIPDNFMWDSWWTEWHWTRFAPNFIHFPQLIIIVPLLHIHLSLPWGVTAMAKHCIITYSVFKLENSVGCRVRKLAFKFIAVSQPKIDKNGFC
jgi:hypothetical protein